MGGNSSVGPRQTRANPAVIDDGLSVMLDIIRFGAALIVCIGHLSGTWLTGGYLWQIAVGLHAAVMVFFVLSGYVIAATTSAEQGGSRYLAARVSRLMSVVLPALAVTAICDSFGLLATPEFYTQTVPSAGGTNPANQTLLAYPLSLLHLQGLLPFRALPTFPGTNGPFWSLSYEAVYYLLFGASLYLRGWVRILAVFAIMLLAGPHVLFLAPIWIFGAVLWKQRARIPDPIGVLLFLTGIAFATLFVIYIDTIRINDVEVLGIRRLAERYAAAITAICLIGGLGAVSHRLRPDRQFTARIRYIADHTFELYLMHIPVGYLAAALSPWPVGSPLRAIFVYAAVFTVVGLSLRVTAPLRRRMRRALLNGRRTAAA